jgi:hypothetical protein
VVVRLERVRAFASSLGLAGEGALVNFEVVGAQEADISRYAVAYREGDEVTGDENIGELSRLFAIAEGGSSVGSLRV